MSSFVIDDYRLDITPQGNYPVVYLSQFEDGRDIRFYMLNRGRSFTIPTGISAFVSGLKSNGGYYEHSCTIDGNYVIMHVEADMTDAYGRGLANIKLTNQSGDTVISAKFVVNVQESVSDSGIEVPTVAETIFQQLLDEIRQKSANISVNVTQLNNNVTQFMSDINNEVNVIDNNVSAVDARMDTFIAQHSGVAANSTKVIEDVLWTGNLYNAYSDDGLGFSIQGYDLNSYDYIDFYMKNANRQHIYRTTPAALLSSTGVQINTTNLTDDTWQDSLPLYASEFQIRAYDNGGNDFYFGIDISNWRWNGKSGDGSWQDKNESSNQAVTKMVGIKYQDVEASKDAELTDIRVGIDGTVYTTAGAAVRGQINDVKSSGIMLDSTLKIAGRAADSKAVGDKIDGIFTEEPTANRFNKDAAVIGSYINPYSGEIAEYSGVFHAFIGFVAGAYTFIAQQGVFGANAYTVPIFDENQNFVSYAEGTHTAIDSMTSMVTVTFSAQAASIGKYFSINGTTDIIDTLMVVKGEQYPSEYVPYGTYKTISGLQISKSQIIDLDELDGNANNLRGKVISINGDSIAAGAGYEGGYGKIIAEENGMTYENIAVGGGTVAYVGTGNHCICRTINNMRADADYVILDGGGNDADAGVPLGTLSLGYDATLDDTTFAGAFESMLKSAIARFPNKKIGYVFIHKCAYLFDSRVANSYYDIAKSACEKWGIPYCDLNTQIPPLNYISALKTVYTASGDGYHPNEQGYKLFYVPKITAWLKTL